MPKKLRGLISNKRHGRRTYKRWREKFRFEVVVTEQKCANCYFFVPSLGAFPGECGACANPVSVHDRQAVAANHGCAQFTPYQDVPIYNAPFNRFAPHDNEFHSTHERWIYLSPYGARARDHWKDEWNLQCGGCRYYVELEGHFSRDWGLCTHPDAAQDGHALFEHDGCEHYTFHVHSWCATAPRAFFRRHSKKDWYNK